MSSEGLDNRVGVTEDSILENQRKKKNPLNEIKIWNCRLKRAEKDRCLKYLHFSVDDSKTELRRERDHFKIIQRGKPDYIDKIMRIRTASDIDR